MQMYINRPLFLVKCKLQDLLEEEKWIHYYNIAENMNKFLMQSNYLLNQKKPWDRLSPLLPEDEPTMLPYYTRPTRCVKFKDSIQIFRHKKKSLLVSRLIVYGPSKTFRSIFYVNCLSDWDITKDRSMKVVLKWYFN